MDEQPTRELSRTEGLLPRSGARSGWIIVLLVLGLIAGVGVVVYTGTLDAEHTPVRDVVASDSDADGLSDDVEARGWRTGTNVVRASSPNLADTDGDGLDDADEADLSLDPTVRDTDEDGIQDGREVNVVGTSALDADTDGDGFSDGFEDADEDDKELSPLSTDVEISASSYVKDLVIGLTLGDLARRGSLAWLLGDLIAGGASYIPVAGVALGSVADIRDAVGSAIRGDWVGSGYSATGLIPVGGDTIAIPKKVAAFVRSNPEQAVQAAKMVASLSKVPAGVKMRSLRATQQGASDLGRAGVSDKALIRLASGRTDLNGLADARNRAGHVEGARAPFMKNRGQALAFTTKASSAPRNRATSLGTARCGSRCVVSRRVVIAKRVALTTKVGYQILTPEIRRQIATDAWALAEGMIAEVQWDFFASAYSNTLGADKALFDRLDAAGITYSIHLPG